MGISGVYKIVNKINGKYYVGKSINIRKRFWRHKSELRRGNHHCVFLQRAWLKYGEESFDFLILKECSAEEATIIEQSILDSKRELIYNTSYVSSGGNVIANHPNYEEVAKKIKKATSEWFSRLTEEERKQKFGRPGEKNSMYGKKHTEEARKKISEKNKGKTGLNSPLFGIKRSDETRKKMSNVASQRVGEKNPFFGKQHSVESRKTISEKNKGKIPPNIKPVIIDNVEYCSMAEASRALGIPVVTILYRVKSINKKFESYKFKE